MKNINIFQTFHKNYPNNPSSEFVKPVGVGGYFEAGFASDSVGVNISILNSSYCELTVQYWAWKNTSSDYVGFFHYRRYLNFILDQTWAAPGNTSLQLSQGSVDYLTSREQFQRVSSLLDVWDVIIPRPLRLLPSIEYQYTSCVEQAPWNEFLKCIDMIYSDQLGVKNYFRLATCAPMWNIFVMRRDLFEDYCRDLFMVVDSIHSAIGSPFDAYQNRYPGFLAERFLGFWLHVKKIRALEVPAVLFD